MSRCCSKFMAFSCSLFANWFGTLINFECDDKDWSKFTFRALFGFESCCWYYAASLLNII